MEPLYRPAVVRQLLSDHRLSPSKALGQNFLVDGNTLGRIVQAAQIRPGDAVIEIGPGLGALTQALVEAGAHVLAIEKDAGLYEVLKELFSDHHRVVLVHEDALNADLERLYQTMASKSGFESAVCKVVANLPYYITSPLIMKVLESDLPLERAVIMVQQEVAERLSATPGAKAYGALSVAVQYRAQVEHVGKVPPTVFYPAPTIGSAIVLLRPRPCPWDVGDEELFFRVVRAAFGKRRKTLKNALRSIDLPTERIDSALAKADIHPGRRGETLSLEEFARLSHSMARI